MGPADQLRQMGFRVKQYNEYHFRVNGEFDFWLPRGKWHDLITGDRGRKPIEQIHFFIKERLADRPCEANKEDFINRLIALGWSREESEEAWTERQSKVTS